MADARADSRLTLAVVTVDYKFSVEVVEVSGDPGESRRTLIHR